ncbi:FAD-dependent oxidoreductase [Neorhodopirellula pilleata]|uniref:Protoporphyrinogen oxidase n=1 Tax=Neorhodopirellula pilleata TaxID=2714738 RepID=A0A5C6AD18_9BACT|nr:FAD-dependent oxidoreductase [Neorhodopirellula pilleata]TWT97330.1 protoporphyrinogen oxidase [Neorhodopirellula pilleata]
MSRIEPLRYSRRELMRMVFGATSVAAFVASGGCDQWPSGPPWFSGPLPPSGTLLSPNREIGHRLRLPREQRITDTGTLSSTRHRCVIVGGGVSGLSAAWHLERNGIDDFVVLELESVVGGTSRGGQSETFRFPWGAHYLPAPQASNPELVAFLHSIGVIESIQGEEIRYAEQYLCREPEERLFARGRWWPGLVPEGLLTPEDNEQLSRFEDLMRTWSTRIGDDGKPFFTLPTSRCSHDPEAVSLDQMSFADWLDGQAFNAPALRWLARYACQDDYGLNPEQTSAWAGVFYFAARLIEGSDRTQPVLTWPEGNAFLVDRLYQDVAAHVQTDQAVMRIDEEADGVLRLTLLDTSTSKPRIMDAEHVILAVPEFVRRRLMPPATMKAGVTSPDQQTEPKRHESTYRYGSWLVANVHLTDRPNETGFPMSWDNVSYASSSLGYVNSVHQTGRDHGATVLTWYTALPEELPGDAPEKIRERLLGMTWAEASEIVISDLETMHPDIRPLVSRLDVMVWGHAMVQPRVGTIFHPQCRFNESDNRRVHVACTDLSRIALFEEAFDHGCRAAMKVASLGVTT